MRQPRLNHDDYGVAIICPLEVELSAMRYMLDEEHPELPGKEGDSNQYIYGRLGVHNVVIGFLPEGSQGIGAAAIVATDMKRTFPHTTLRLLVGIGGGVPSKYDVRLGDVVVSMPDKDHGGVVQYDLGKGTVTGFERKGLSEPPPAIWRTCVVKMKSDQRTKDNRISEFIGEMITKYPKLVVYNRPPAGKDVLFEPSSVHPSGEASCQKCDRSRVVEKPPPVRNSPTVFYGLIASGNQVVKDARKRNRIAQDAGGALCIEMEAAGLMNDFKCVVIRGISDYADSHKNDDWHAYSAAVAAGCAKELLTYMESATNPVSLNRNMHWTIARTTNPNFTGRDDLITKISEILLGATKSQPDDEQCRVVLNGMGGQGKSELCLHVANRVRNAFWGVFWVDVSTVVSAEKDFLLLGGKLGIPGANIDNVRHHLASSDQPWLLILDNADDIDLDYQRYLPTGHTGVIMLTSRNPECSIYATKLCLQLDGLGVTEAVQVLFKAARIPDPQHLHFHTDAENVAITLLKGHPLALIQAGAYIAQGHSSIADYAEIFQRERKRLLTFQPRQARSRYGNVYATFEASAISLQATQDQAASDAVELLLVLAMFAASPIPLSWFRNVWKSQAYKSRNIEDYDEQTSSRLTPWYISQLPSFLNAEEEQWNPFRLVQAVRTLEAYSLITVTGTRCNMSVSMHPLTHAWARDRQSVERQQQAWLVSGSIVALYGSDNSYFANPEHKLRNHLVAFVSARTETFTSEKPPLKVLGILIGCGQALRQLSLTNHAYDLMKQLLTWIEQDGETEDEKWLELYELAGLIAVDSWHSKEAVLLLEKVVSIRDQILAKDDLVRLGSQWALSYACYADGQITRAIELLKKVEHTCEPTLGPRHPDRIKLQYSLAECYMRDGQLTRATELLEEVLKIDEQTLAKDHRERLESQYALARVYYIARKMPQAIVLLEEIVGIIEQTLPEDHPFLLASQSLLAKAYMYQEGGQPSKAISLAEQVVKVGEQTLARDHPDQLASWYLLAMVYKEDGQLSRAIRLMKEVVEIRERTLDESHPDRLESQCEFAKMLWDAGNHVVALEMMQKVVDLARHIFDAQHPDRIPYENSLRKMKEAM